MQQETRMGGDRMDFPTTCWSRVLGARELDLTTRRKMMEELLSSYWKPLYCCIRYGWGRSTEEAKDQVQEFFVHLLEKDFLRNVDPAKGRFRSFLKSALRNFLLNQQREAGRIKRGGGVKFIPIDEADELHAAPGEPDQVFDKEWARTLLQTAVAKLREGLAVAGREKYFLVFDLHDMKSTEPSYRKVGEELGLSENDVRNYLHSARLELRRILREELARYALDESDLEDELRWILG